MEIATVFNKGVALYCTSTSEQVHPQTLAAHQRNPLPFFILCVIRCVSTPVLDVHLLVPR